MSNFPARTSKEDIEHGLMLRPKFDSDGLIPCITTDASSGEVLMFAYMNDEALHHTIESGKATYWSRSRKKRWVKGEESGRVQKVKELRVDCDQDVVLLKVDVSDDGCCHNGYRSCFYRRLSDPKTMELEQAIAERAFDPKDVYKK